MLDGAEAVLDIGCGTGRWIAAQREHFPKALFVGLDPSRAMLKEATAKGVAPLVRGRAEALPFVDSSFDVVATSYVFHHVTDKQRALDEIARVLAPSGTFRLNNLEPGESRRWGWWLYRYFPDAVAIDDARFWDVPRLVAALELRGFEVEVALESGPTQIRADEALADAERRVISQLAMIDDEAYESGLAQLRADVAADPDAILPTSRSRFSLRCRR